MTCSETIQNILHTAVRLLAVFTLSFISPTLEVIVVMSTSLQLFPHRRLLLWKKKGGLGSNGAWQGKVSHQHWLQEYHFYFLTDLSTLPSPHTPFKKGGGEESGAQCRTTATRTAVPDHANKTPPSLAPRHLPHFRSPRYVTGIMCISGMSNIRSLGQMKHILSSVIAANEFLLFFSSYYLFNNITSGYHLVAWKLFDLLHEISLTPQCRLSLAQR